MGFLTLRTNDGLDTISTEAMADFEFDGARFRLLDAQAGITKPKELDAALSIRTTFTPPGKDRPYDDHVGEDGFLRYKWRGTDPEHHQVRGLREAMRSELPLVWFVGIAPGVYQPLFPVYILWEEPDQHQFVIDPDVARGKVTGERPPTEIERRYILHETKRRVHQPLFRAVVLRAYEERCAVCALRPRALLDAAHIVEDSSEEGVAAVRNGLTLCKIHHAAYDSDILGIRPDLIVEIRPDLLDVTDGPMLLHGIQGRHGQGLMALPRSRAEQPDPELLGRRFERFKSAS